MTIASTSRDPLTTSRQLWPRPSHSAPCRYFARTNTLTEITVITTTTAVSIVMKSNSLATKITMTTTTIEMAITTITKKKTKLGTWKQKLSAHMRWADRCWGT